MHSRPKGFWPCDSLGSDIAPKTRAYSVTAAVNTTYNICHGDVVYLDSSGTVLPGYTGGEGKAVVGVAAGFLDSAGKSIAYLPAATDGTVLVWDDPNLCFTAQMGAGGLALTALVSLNADHVYAAGNTATGISNYTLGVPATGTAQFRILGLLGTPENVVSATDQVVIVKFNEHAYLSGLSTDASTGTAGV